MASYSDQHDAFAAVKGEIFKREFNPNKLYSEKHLWWSIVGATQLINMDSLWEENILLGVVTQATMTLSPHQPKKARPVVVC